jgi:hypothetical protein
MPNWAYNYLTVSGPVDKMDKWRIALQNEKSMEPLLTLDKLFPLPEEEKENWYDWRVKNWGTKWDISDDGLAPEDSSPTEYMYHFETAWSPPLEWLAYIAADFPGIKFELGWYEEQMYFGGVLVIKDGTVIQNDYYENAEFYNWAEDYFGLDFRENEEGDW